jgi:hypothetical protein
MKNLHYAILFSCVLLPFFGQAHPHPDDYTDAHSHTKMSQLAGIIVLFLFVVVIPTLVCIAHWKRPAWFAEWKAILWLLGSAVFSWTVVNASIWIPYWIEPWMFRGPEIFGILFLSWAFLWFASIPVVAVYLILRFIGLVCYSFNQARSKRLNYEKEQPLCDR